MEVSYDVITKEILMIRSRIDIIFSQNPIKMEKIYIYIYICKIDKNWYKYGDLELYMIDKIYFSYATPKLS